MRNEREAGLPVIPRDDGTSSSPSAGTSGQHRV